MILVGLYVSCVGSNMFGKIQKNDRNMSKKDREVYANVNFVIGNCLALDLQYLHLYPLTGMVCVRT